METFYLVIDQIVSQALLWSPKLLAVIFISVVFVVIYKLLKQLLAKSVSTLKLDTSLAILFQRSLRVLLIVLAIVTILGTLGVDIAALVAGLGLTGFALGFALKDTISNILSGVLLLIYRPFVIGSEINIAGFTGKVISIDMRYTTLQDTEKTVLIPNSKLFTDPITVLTHPD